MTNQEAEALYGLFQQLSSDYHCTMLFGHDVQQTTVRLMDRTSFVLAVMQLGIKSSALSEDV